MKRRPTFRVHRKIEIRRVRVLETATDIEAPVLTPDQERRRVERLRNCIHDLGKFDPQKVQKRYQIPEVMALEAGIKDALAAAFGEGAPAFLRYQRAASLDNGPHMARVGNAFGRGPQIDYDAQEAQEARGYLAEGKRQSTAVLEQAIQTIEAEIADEEAAARPMAGEDEATPMSRRVFIVHGHEGEPREAVAEFLRKIDFTPVILHEQSNQGRTIVEKFEAHADVDFAIVLLPVERRDARARGADGEPRQHADDAALRSAR